MRSVLEEVVGALSDALSVPVYPYNPQERPDEFVVVDPVGGMSTVDALHPQYAVQAWSTDYLRAESIVRECCDALKGMGGTPFADPVPLGYDGRHFWWQTTYTIHALW